MSDCGRRLNNGSTAHLQVVFKKVLQAFSDLMSSIEDLNTLCFRIQMNVIITNYLKFKNYKSGIGVNEWVNEWTSTVWPLQRSCCKAVIMRWYVSIYSSIYPPCICEGNDIRMKKKKLLLLQITRNTQIQLSNMDKCLCSSLSFPTSFYLWYNLLKTRYRWPHTWGLVREIKKNTPGERDIESERVV